MPSHLHPPSTLHPGSIVWAYLRDSGGPTQDRSISQQRAQLEDYCQRHALTLTLVFADVARSGSSTTGRDQFHEMIDMSKHESTRPAAILIWNYARFARDLDDSQYYKSLLRKRGILIHSLTDPIPEGLYAHVIEVIIDISNQEKIRQTSRDTRRGLHDLVRIYGCVPGTPPRGFMRQLVTDLPSRRDGSPRTAHRWVPDPEWIPRIQTAFKMRAAGASLDQIHKATRIFGSLNSYTTFWTNQLYIGTLIFGDFTVPGYCQPLIDQDTWDAVQRLQAKFAARANLRSDQTHPRRLSSNYLLSGLCICARCQSPLYGHTSPQRNGGRLEAYRCTRAHRRRDCDLPRIPAHALEHGLLEKMRTILGETNLYEQIYRQATANQAARTSQLEQQRKDFQKDIAAIGRKIKNITAAIRESGHSRALLNELADLETQRDDLHAQLTAFTHTAATPLPALTAEQLTAKSRRLAEKLTTSDPETTRAVLRGLIETIQIDRHGDQIHGIITIYIDAETGPAAQQKSPNPSDNGYNLDSDPDKPAVSLSHTSLGTPLHRHSIPFFIKAYKKPRSR